MNYNETIFFVKIIVIKIFLYNYDYFFKDRAFNCCAIK